MSQAGKPRQKPIKFFPTAIQTASGTYPLSYPVVTGKCSTVNIVAGI
jgi:hypothetical protein